VGRPTQPVWRRHLRAALRRRPESQRPLPFARARRRLRTGGSDPRSLPPPASAGRR
jgi:hypothetical protein